MTRDERVARENSALDIFLENPFRVLGLPVTASPRQISKRVHDLSMFSEFGRVPEYPGDLPFIDGLDRSPESIERAAQRLELPERKLHFANFWFWIDNSIDELVMEVLQDGDIDKALSLWHRSIENNSPSAKTLSNHWNHALLSFISSSSAASKAAQLEPQSLRIFMQRAVKTWSHSSYLSYAARIAGATHTVKADSVLVKCADEFAKLLSKGGESPDVVLVKSLIAAFAPSSVTVQRHVKSKFTSSRVKKIEGRIAACSAACDEEPESAHEQGVALYRECAPEIAYLRQLLSAGDPHVASISDKVANELIDCSNVIYREVDETERALALSKELSQYANKLAVGLRVKKRVDDDLAIIEKLLKDHRLNGLVRQIEAELNRIPDPDGPMPPGVRSIEIVKRLIANTKGPLLKLWSVGGDGSALYEQFGGVVATIALIMCIRFANETNNYSLVTPLLREIEPLPMTNEQRAHFLRNKEILEMNLAVEAANLTSAKNSGGGCYIATLVYGGAEEPPVIKLRQYRDTVLIQSVVGRLFVRTYYLVAPTLASWLRPVPSVQRLVRVVLDQLTRRLP